MCRLLYCCNSGFTLGDVVDRSHDISFFFKKPSSQPSK